MSNLDLLLVNPSAKAETYGPLSELSAIEPPLWCALLASYVRERGPSVAILDAEAEGLGARETAERITEAKPLLAAIIVMGCNPSVSSTPKMTAVEGILRGIRPGILTLLAGLHPSALPEKTLYEVPTDFVVQGEGFQTIALLLTYGMYWDIPGLWTRGVSRPPPAPLIHADELPTAAWDLLPMERYRAHNWHCLDRLDERSPYAMTWTSLGCMFKCYYCNVHALHNSTRSIRLRDPKKVTEEIDHLVKNYGVRNIKFMDEMFALNKKRVMEVCDQIISLGHDLNIWAYARADTVDGEMLGKMREAGIRWVCFGFESGSKTVRQGVAKRYGQERIARVARMCREAGVNIMANFMFGLPDDDLETMQETLDMAKAFNFEYANFYACAAYPGSHLYEEAVRQGVRLPETWADYSQFSPSFLPLPTKHLKAEEVLEFRDCAFQEYFNRPEYLRMVDGKFGAKAREHIEEMLKVNVERRSLGRTR